MKSVFIALFLLFAAFHSRAQVGRISFSSGGGSNPRLPTSIGESFISSNPQFSVGSRKSTIDTTTTNVPVKSANSRIKLFPNPAKDELEVAVEGKEQFNFSIVITTMTGLRVAHYGKISERIIIPLRELSPGSYVVSILSSSGVLLVNQQIVKY